MKRAGGSSYKNTKERKWLAEYDKKHPKDKEIRGKK
jgi:hypothetical protein